MKILDRYIFRELFQVFIVGLFALMSILILEKIKFLSETILEKGVSLGELAQLIVYISPAFLMVSIPLAILLATLVGFSRLSADNEITAMRACGIGFYRILMPVLALSLLAGGVSAYLSLGVQHVGNLKFMNLLTTIMSREAGMVVGERTFFDRFPDTVIYVSEKPAGSDLFKGVFISDRRDPERPRTITARLGQVVSSEENIVLRLQNGSIYSEKGGSYRIISYDNYDLVLDTGSGGRAEFVKQPREMSIAEMKVKIMERSARNETCYSEQVELYKRYALPVSCIVFGLLGAPLGIRVHRGGRWGGMGIGIMMMIANYILFLLGEGLGKEGKLEPVVAMWLPNVLMGSIAAFLVYKTSRETMPFKITLWFQSKWFALEAWVQGRKRRSDDDLPEPGENLTFDFAVRESSRTATSPPPKPKPAERKSGEDEKVENLEIAFEGFEAKKVKRDYHPPKIRDGWHRGVLTQEGRFYAPCGKRFPAWIAAYSHSQNCPECRLSPRFEPKEQ